MKEKNQNMDVYEWFHYAHGYYEAVRILMFGVKNQSQWNEPSHMMPILNALFHYIEIMCKGILLKNNKHFERNHKLGLLFTNVYSHLVDSVNDDAKYINIINPITKNDINELKKFIDELGKYHRKHNFRYPNDENNVLTRIIKFDFDDFLAKVNRIHSLLDSAYFDPFALLKNQS